MPVLKKYCLIVAVIFTGLYEGRCLAMDRKTPASIATPPEDFFFTDSLPDDRPRFVINCIIIYGNRKTRPYIIERELPFKKGDSVYLPQLVSQFQRAKELLINTRLFNDVVVSLKGFNGYQVDVLIEVKERWYIFPIPYFKPVDRNLSAWADKNYSLSRINYGLKFTHNNFTGRNDKLRLWLISGYTRQVQLNYEQPYADKSLKRGFGVGFSYAALKEINYGTIYNQQQFVQADLKENEYGTINKQQPFIQADSLPVAGKYLTEQASFSLGYFYRPAIKTRHLIRLSFFYNKIDSAVMLLNPKYFSNENRRIFFPEISYTLEYQNVDYVAYALRGFMGDINFTKRGINKDMNLWQFTGRFTKGWPLGGKFYFGLQGNGAVKLPFDQPFVNQRLFGYGDFYLRGLERYVVDGVAGGLLRGTLRRQLFNLSFPSRIPTMDRIPVKIYAKVFSDAGYAYNKNFLQNSLVNQMLYSAGAGIDLVTTYDLVFRCEYSFNQLGQSGFFFHIRNEF